ncbi:MAG: permease [Gemmatimonas sp. SG8_38_2]|nr:MAG: permease [Gemmatimonas sp. SG8_38_2]
MEPERFRRMFILFLALAISAVFLQMIRGLFLSVLLAGIFAGMTYPLYSRLTRWFRGHKVLASIVSILVVLMVIIVPVTAFFGIVAAQAVEVAQGVAPWVERQIAQPSELERRLVEIPIVQTLAPYHDQIAVKLAEFAGNVGTFLVNTIAAGTKGTAIFFFHMFVMLYAMFFFLIDGNTLLNKILYLMPMTTEQEVRMVDRFTSVARATIKGTLVIGIIQGGLAGLAFAAAGLKGAAFWGTIMAVLSIIPGVGTALVWVPAVIYLMAVGRFTAAILLLIWCAAVVGTVDNLLRPRLVGKDTKMPDLLILLGTLGGLVLFGAVGIIIGPIVAALFVTVWDIYGEAFKDYLPAVQPIGSSDG